MYAVYLRIQYPVVDMLVSMRPVFWPDLPANNGKLAESAAVIGTRLVWLGMLSPTARMVARFRTESPGSNSSTKFSVAWWKPQPCQGRGEKYVLMAEEGTFGISWFLFQTAKRISVLVSCLPSVKLSV